MARSTILSLAAVRRATFAGRLLKAFPRTIGDVEVGTIATAHAYVRVWLKPWTRWALGLPAKLVWRRAPAVIDREKAIGVHVDFAIMPERRERHPNEQDFA